MEFLTKQVFFRQFGLLSGITAILFISLLSYVYYRAQASSSHVYENLTANMNEYRLLDSRAGNYEDLQTLLDYYLMEKSLMFSSFEIMEDLKAKSIPTPSSAELSKIESSIFLRIRYINECINSSDCNYAILSNSLNTTRFNALDGCEKILAEIKELSYQREEEFSQNLRLFYILSVLLLLSTLFFAALRK